MSEKRINNSDLHQENIDTKDDSVLNKVSEEISDLPGGDGNSTVSGKQAKKKRGSRGKGRRKKNKKSMGKKPWIIAGSIVGGLLVIYLGVAAFFMSHFLINTTVNGKDFSGKTVDDVEEYLKNQVADYELTVLEQNNISDVITGSDISLTYQENSQASDALKAQNQLLWITSLFSKYDTDMIVQVEYVVAAIDEKLKILLAVTDEQTDPVLAHPEYDGNSFVVADEQYGTKVDMETLTAKIKQYITEFRTSLDMMDEECYVMPAYTSDSPEVQAACDEMNSYLKASITYPMDENVVVDK